MHSYLKKNQNLNEEIFLFSLKMFHFFKVNVFWLIRTELCPVPLLSPLLSTAVQLTSSVASYLQTIIHSPLGSWDSRKV